MWRLLRGLVPANSVRPNGKLLERICRYKASAMSQHHTFFDFRPQSSSSARFCAKSSMIGIMDLSTE